LAINYTTMINDAETSLPIIQSMWIGSELSAMEQLSIRSFLQNGHQYHLYVYDEVKNVPEGVVLQDAGKIMSPNRIFKYKDRDTYAGFANVFRYKLLLEKGSFWVDTDVVCLRPFDAIADYVFVRTRSLKSNGNLDETFRVENCIIKVPKGSDVMRYCYEVSSRQNPEDLEFGETGPYFLRPTVIKFNLEKYVARAETFCPIDWPQWYKFLSSHPFVYWTEMAKMALYRTKAVHLWNEMWRLNGVEKNGAFPEHCIYEQLKRRYPDES
jgi:Glycosyltransferase sugar-binding region containing DXD motif